MSQYCGSTNIGSSTDGETTDRGARQLMHYCPLATTETQFISLLPIRKCNN
ncbi:hypothetical protein YPPY66_3338 [Yersinia pestis PY-66]|uniref:Transposase n=1 Tax=Yersinia pestis PY-08 TaxID=992134 RepID=A0AB72ZH70_YERPE|nr:hypothetical protein YPD27_3323 [Yersinia pestis KIM D27]EIQ86992.1 hypothetical protein YPPY01_3007 [Yersinia pestis PY-01]EIQ88128.1 hypothetical protein YPPY02_3048 [Yersinia pestis PY-02]EIQ88793.1 hypothetical protein YPPY03_3111 [Yersinia pestis PY-03]EIR00455.1 hypothetical protein YPPY04_3064 [Yersinia pestis PY-04]EIR01829.1 hypothetical protein YPPY05_3045 [Yersinia pestis PY-05]EIR04989.1 hypothetical protein YPPY06_3096 [Yersinia pestis PY-06]EIR15695.1 hypothetical protein YP